MPQVIADIIEFQALCQRQSGLAAATAAFGQGRSGDLPAAGTSREARRAARGYARADPGHHPRMAKIQDGSIAVAASGGAVKAAPWRDPHAHARTCGSSASANPSAISRRSMTSASTSIKARSFVCSARRAAARPRCLRMLGGFETPTSGRIFIDGEDMTGVPPYERPVNMMFQSYALFPHMTVEQNVAFGLKQDRAAEGRDRRTRRHHAGPREARRLRQAQTAPVVRRPAPARRARALAGQAA